MYFNRFAVEREDGFVRIQFACLNQANVLLDSYGTAISEMELNSMKKATMDYLGGQGTLLDAPPKWQPVGAMATEVSNHIIMAHHGPIAETILYSFSFWAALEESKRAREPMKSKEPNSQELAKELGIMAEPIAMLRSPLNVQQHLIRLLFQTEQPSLLAGQ